MEKLHVAHISENDDPLGIVGGEQAGGMGIYVRDLAASLAALHVSCDIYTRQMGGIPHAMARIAPNARVIRVNTEPIDPGNARSAKDFAAKVLEYIARNHLRYDLIHSHYYLSGLAAAHIKEQLGIPLVHTFHSLGLMRQRAVGANDARLSQRIAIEGELARLSDAIIATSPEEKISLMRQYRVSSETISLIPAGIVTGHFVPIDRKAAQRKLKLPDKPMVLFAARINQRKGADTFIAMIKMLVRDHKLDVLGVVLTGDPRPRYRSPNERRLLERLRRLINRLGMQAHILMLPCQPQQMLRYYYSAAAVTVVPSYYEPFGLVAIESMAMGTPVVASRVGGLKWSLQDGITGFLVPPKEPRLFADRVSTILSQPHLAQRLSENCLEISRRKFLWHDIAKDILKVYQKTMQQ
ncbi:glycosyltransferase [Candidatus Berkelbacteria bacterium]|nr:glycosyltransferase [Candidatus Berkelbacteria bacterium]